MIRGQAAIAMWCDVADAAWAGFAEWHTHEHMPERLAIPGFNRGSRWRAAAGGEGRFILYEAATLATISSGPYLERLNNPTPWSRKMMPSHRNMVRSLCEVVSSHGAGLAGFLLTVRQSARPAHDWAELPRRRGIAAVHLLKDVQAGPATPTTEQKIRGGDSHADWIVLVNGYDRDVLAALARDELGGEAVSDVYVLDYELSAP